MLLFVKSFASKASSRCKHDKEGESPGIKKEMEESHKATKCVNRQYVLADVSTALP